MIIGCYFTGPIRLETVVAPALLLNNARASVATKTFTLVRCKRDLVEANMSFPHYGTVVFKSNLSKRSQFYRLKTGLTFAHAGVIYGEDDANITASLPRLLAYDRQYCKIENGVVVPDYCSEIDIQMRTSAFSKTRLWKRRLAHLKYAFDQYFYSNFVDWFDKQYEYPTLPHVKRDLRMSAKKDIDDRLGWLSLQAKTIKTKIKTSEWAKYGKKPRNICDIGVEGSLVAGVCCEFLKKFMAEYEFSADVECKFHAKPDSSSLKTAFHNVYHANKRINWHYFSDDAIVSILCGDGIMRCNLDISSADSSHQVEIFDSIADLVKDTGYFAECVLKSIQQLSMPLRVANTHGQVCAVLQPNVPRLYSGSTLTTLVNNFSQLWMATHISRFRFESVAQCRSLLPAYISQVGYSVTLDIVHKIQDLQFLKFSPDKNFNPFINLGPYIRMCGWSKRDIPKVRIGCKRQTLYNRSFIFESTKIHGYNSLHNNSLHNLLAAKYNCVADVEVELPYHLIDAKIDYLQDADICERYCLSHLEWYSFLDGVRSCLTKSEHHHLHFRHIVIDKILAKDYGYGQPVSHDV